MRRPVLPQDEEQRKEWIDWQQVAQKTAIVSGIFSLMLMTLLLVNHINLNRDDPLQTTQLIALKQQLMENPNDQNLKEIIRDTDSTLRAQFFSRYHKQNQGGVVLTISLAIFFLALRIAWINKPLPPDPGPDPHKAQEHRRELRLGRLAVLGLIVVMCSSAAALTTTVKRNTPGYVDPEAASTPSGPVIPEWEELQQQWPSFRGMGANARIEVPTWAREWSKDKGVQWQERLALDGLNAAVIWNDRVFATGAIESQRYVYCLSARTGKTMWRHQVKDVEFSPAEHPHTESFTGYAAPTAACDGNNVYAIFANGDLVAVSMDGQQQWAFNVGFHGNLYGYSASLALYKHLLYVQVDQDEGSYITAIDTMSGKSVWEQEREPGGSWGSPAVMRADDRYLVVCNGNPYATAYDALSGEVVWQHELMAGDVAPTPISADGIAYVVNMGCPLAAIDATGNILWKAEGGAWPDTSSPVTDGEYIWLLDSMGTLSCVSCADGSIVYEEGSALSGDFTASPTIVNDEIMLISNEGKVFIVARKPAFELKRSFDTGIPVQAAPSFDRDGNLYLRSGKHVYCIGTAP